FEASRTAGAGVAAHRGEVRRGHEQRAFVPDCADAASAGTAILVHSVRAAAAAATATARAQIAGDDGCADDRQRCARGIENTSDRGATDATDTGVAATAAATTDGHAAITGRAASSADAGGMVRTTRAPCR